MWEYYWVYYVMGIIMIPSFIITIWAQTKVTNSVNTYSEISSKSGIKACDLIRSLLDSVGLKNIQVIRIQGNLTDYFDSKKGVIALSQNVYDSSSIAALGIACHEFGHALQWQKHYFPLKLRQFLIPVTRFLSVLMWPLVILGLLFNFALMIPGGVGDILLIVGASIFGLSILISLVTLPVEYNASNRALSILKGAQVLDEEELDGAHEVLYSAGLTYVAALVTSVLTALRFLLTIFIIRNRNNRR